MSWHKLGYAAFVALLVSVVITGQPHSMTPKSGGCTGISGANGVIVDADGVLHKRTFEDPSGQLSKERMQAARAQLDRKLAANSKLRKVSLNRLEAAVREQHGKNQPITDEMKYLAGLTRVRYVFFYPETKDIVLAGPAEGFAADLSGRVVGIDSGKATLELQDLVTALRAYPPSGKKTPVILCSIDPTQEGLARKDEFQKHNKPSSPDQVEAMVEGMRSALGLQKIRVQGVPANSHFAQVLIEADYRMKLIGIGLEHPAIKLASYVDKAAPHGRSNSNMQRWFFIPDYECVRVTADDLGMEMVGNGVKLVGEDQLVSADGSRHVTGKADKASQQFVDGFTRKYPELAAKTPVYAQLRNCIDMAVAAAFIQQHDYYHKAGWAMETFADEKAVPVETLNLPTHVDTAANVVWKGSSVMTPIGGGVTIYPPQALNSSNLLSDEEGKVAQLRESLDLKQIAPNQWWWD